jgi:hypothetical protein
MDVKTVHDIAESLAKIQQTLNNASVLGRQGALEVEASVERRVEQQQRLAKEHAEARRQHDQLVDRLFPNGPGTDETGESAPNGPGTDETGESAGHIAGEA